MKEMKAPVHDENSVVSKFITIFTTALLTQVIHSSISYRCLHLNAFLRKDINNSSLRCFTDRVKAKQCIFTKLYGSRKGINIASLRWFTDCVKESTTHLYDASRIA